jgi:ribosomal protein S18 acetylase RimI-like enzyme
VSGPRIWRAGLGDAEEVATLLVAFRDHLGLDWPSDNAFLAGVERLLEDPATEYLLAAPAGGGPPVAMAQLRFRFAVWRASDDCLLEDLFVSPQARRSGLGRALLRAVEDRARARGCRRIELDTAETNEGALALYRGAGFDNDAYEGGRALFLRKRLDRE